ncbi:hypothetical protein [Flavobacterium sp. DG2-3]|uniref:hypothetical protein n=1 Tax=Flavobacterium sp. DG2-3 TaxID=3068317 RepID=UPI00273D1F30|nr:hypothetical protein [Flavobacterium sp. DG2-3]MDP5201900.1 hypothetical protein [Flavobacterium sp. DG2-3]
MKLVNIFRILGLTKTQIHSNEEEGELNLHHHDLTDGCELLDETVHMKEQPFDENEEEDYASIF